jgi:hypothetical protein
MDNIGFYKLMGMHAVLASMAVAFLFGVRILSKKWAAHLIKNYLDVKSKVPRKQKLTTLVVTLIAMVFISVLMYSKMMPHVKLVLHQSYHFYFFVMSVGVPVFFLSVLLQIIEKKE